MDSYKNATNMLGEMGGATSGGRGSLRAMVLRNHPQVHPVSVWVTLSWESHFESDTRTNIQEVRADIPAHARNCKDHYVNLVTYRGSIVTHDPDMMK